MKCVICGMEIHGDVGYTAEGGPMHPECIIGYLLERMEVAGNDAV